MVVVVDTPVCVFIFSGKLWSGGAVAEGTAVDGDREGGVPLHVEFYVPVVAHAGVFVDNALPAQGVPKTRRTGPRTMRGARCALRLRSVPVALQEAAE